MSFNFIQVRQSIYQTGNDGQKAFQYTTHSSTVDILTKSFDDRRIVLSNNNNFLMGQSYFFRAKIEKLKRPEGKDYTIAISLSNDDNNNNTKFSNQLIGEYLINSAISTNPKEYFWIERIITPNNDYSNLDIDIEREAADYLAGNSQIITVSSAKIFQLKNLLPAEAIPSKKIGIEGPPGLLMSINHQEIRIPPSGLFEIKNGYKVDFIGAGYGKLTSGARYNDYIVINAQY